MVHNIWEVAEGRVQADMLAGVAADGSDDQAALQAALAAPPDPRPRELSDDERLLLVLRRWLRLFGLWLPRIVRPQQTRPATHQELFLYGEARSRWEELLFCTQCRLAFPAGSSKTIRPEAVQEYLYIGPAAVTVTGTRRYTQAMRGVSATIST